MEELIQDTEFRKKIINFVLARMSRYLKNIDFRTCLEFQNVELQKELMNKEYLGGLGDGFEIVEGKIGSLKLNIPQEKMLNSFWILDCQDVVIRMKAPKLNIQEGIFEILRSLFLKGSGSRNSLLLTKSLVLGGIFKGDIEKSFSSNEDSVKLLLDTILSKIRCRITNLNIHIDLSEEESLTCKIEKIEMQDTSMNSSDISSMNDPILKYSLVFSNLTLESNDHELLKVMSKGNEVTITITLFQDVRHTYVDLRLYSPMLIFSPKSLQLFRKLFERLQVPFLSSSLAELTSDDDTDSFHSVVSGSQTPRERKIDFGNSMLESQVDHVGNVDIRTDIATCIRYTMNITDLKVLLFYSPPKELKGTHLKINAPKVTMSSYDDVDKFEMEATLEKLSCTEIWDDDSAMHHIISETEVKLSLAIKKATKKTIIEFILPRDNVFRTELCLGMLDRIKPLFRSIFPKHSSPVTENSTQKQDQENQVLFELQQNNYDDVRQGDIELRLKCDEFQVEISFPIEGEEHQYYPNKLKFKVKHFDFTLKNNQSDFAELISEEIFVYIDSELIFQANPKKISVSLNNLDDGDEFWSISVPEHSFNDSFPLSDLDSPPKRNSTSSNLFSNSSVTDGASDTEKTLHHAFTESETKISIQLNSLVVDFSKEKAAKTNQLFMKLLDRIKTIFHESLNDNRGAQVGISLSSGTSRFLIRNHESKGLWNYSTEKYEGIMLVGSTFTRFFSSIESIDLSSQGQKIFQSISKLIKPFRALKKHLIIDFVHHGEDSSLIEATLSGVSFEYQHHEWISDLLDTFGNSTNDFNYNFKLQDIVVDGVSNLRRLSHRSISTCDLVTIIQAKDQTTVNFEGLSLYAHETFKATIQDFFRSKTPLFGIQSQLQKNQFTELIALDKMKLLIDENSNIVIKDATICFMISKEMGSVVLQEISESILKLYTLFTEVQDNDEMEFPPTETFLDSSQCFYSEEPSPLPSLMNPTVTENFSSGKVTFERMESVVIARHPALEDHKFDAQYFEITAPELLNESTSEPPLKKFKILNMNLYCTFWEKESTDTIELQLRNISSEFRFLKGNNWDLNLVGSDLKIIDNIAKSNRKHMIYGHKKLYDEGKPFFELKLSGGTKWSLEFFIQPLRFNLHQQQKIFLNQFFESGSWMVGGNVSQPDFQLVKIHPINILLDYEADTLQLSEIPKNGKAELINAANISDLEIQLDEIYFLHKCHSWGDVISKVVESYLNNLPTSSLGIALGFLPIRSAVNVGSGLIQLFYVPLNDDNINYSGIFKHMIKGVGNYAVTVAKESATFSAGIAESTAKALNFSGETKRKHVPSDAKEGAQKAFEVFKEGFKQSATAAIQIPKGENLTKQVAITIFSPMSGAANALSQIASGCRMGFGDQKIDTEQFKK